MSFKKFKLFLIFFTLSLGILLCFTNCDTLGIATGNKQYSLIPFVGLSSTYIPNNEFFYVNIHSAYYTGREFDSLDALIYSMDEGPGTDCKIPVEQESSEDLYCLMDIMEGDLWFHQIALEYNVPAGMCDYLSFRVPWHWNQKVGYGPATVYECDDYLGALPTCERQGGDDVFPDPETKYCLGGCVQESLTCGEDTEQVTTECGRGPAVDEVQSFCGDLNKSNIDGLHNCCMGEYQLCKDGGCTDASWGGDVQSCLGGMARISWEDFTKKGIPQNRLENVSKDGFRSTHDIPPLVGAYDGRNISSIPPAFITANYYTDIEDKEFEKKQPAFYIPPTNSELNSTFDQRSFGEVGYPYMTWTCFDKAYEIKHRIHLAIREWNTQAEFNKFVESTGSRGDPDIVGEEGEVCDYYTSQEPSLTSDTDCNDREDIDDWEAKEDRPQPWPEIFYR